MDEPCRLRRGEGYGACGDEGAAGHQQAAEVYTEALLATICLTWNDVGELCSSAYCNDITRFTRTNHMVSFAAGQLSLGKTMSYFSTSMMAEPLASKEMLSASWGV